MNTSRSIQVAKLLQAGIAAAHLGGVIAGLTCLYFFLPAEMLYYRYRSGEAA